MVSVARSPSNSPVGGGRVVCADIDPVRANETVGLVVRAGGKGLDIACDVSVEKQVREWPTAPRSGFGKSISLVINAGIGAGGSVIGAISKSDWERPLLSTNHLSRSQLPPWRPASYTRVLGLSSESGAEVLRNKNKETASWHSNTATCSR